jgi:hypothetical protein
MTQEEVAVEDTSSPTAAIDIHLLTGQIAVVTIGV